MPEAAKVLRTGGIEITSLFFGWLNNKKKQFFAVSSARKAQARIAHRCQRCFQQRKYSLRIKHTQKHANVIIAGKELPVEKH
jgi:hypothetical protein